MSKLYNSVETAYTSYFLCHSEQNLGVRRVQFDNYEFKY